MNFIFKTLVNIKTNKNVKKDKFSKFGIKHIFIGSSKSSTKLSFTQILEAALKYHQAK